MALIVTLPASFTTNSNSATLPSKPKFVDLVVKGSDFIPLPLNDEKYFVESLKILKIFKLF